MGEEETDKWEYSFRWTRDEDVYLRAKSKLDDAMEKSRHDFVEDALRACLLCIVAAAPRNELFRLGEYFSSRYQTLADEAKRRSSQS